MNVWVYGIALACMAFALVLFLGGMLSAAWEIRQERKTTGTVTRPGWQRRSTREAAEIARLEQVVSRESD